MKWPLKLMILIFRNVYWLKTPQKTMAVFEKCVLLHSWHGYFFWGEFYICFFWLSANTGQKKENLFNVFFWVLSYSFNCHWTFVFNAQSLSFSKSRYKHFSMICLIFLSFPWLCAIFICYPIFHILWLVLLLQSLLDIAIMKLTASI